LKSRKVLLLSLTCRRGHVDLRSAAVEDFAAKEKQGDHNEDDKNDEDGDDAGTRSTTFSMFE
jgi:hypothetical protein